jgi:hypothetical protein
MTLRQVEAPLTAEQRAQRDIELARKKKEAGEAFEERRVEVFCDPRNERSAAVARRVGFVHEGTLRQRILGVDGRPRDSHVFALTPADWAAHGERIRRMAGTA